MDADVDISAAAALLGDPARASMLAALADVDGLPAGELARRAGVTPPTASSHLAKLEAGGLVSATRHGRHRCFRLAGADVAAALEALALIAPRRPVRSLRDADAGSALRQARTCYDHLAGAAGVELLAALLRLRALHRLDGGYALSRRGEQLLGSLGVDLDGARAARRTFARDCLDWSERRHHLAGALGAALTSRMLELGWLARRPSTRAVTITPRGRDGLHDAFGISR